MTTPIRTTLIFGILSALSVIPLTHYLSILWGWPVALKSYVLINLMLYSILLCRWSNARIVSIIVPLSLLTGMVLWPLSCSGFVLVSLGVLGWIRSGICFKELSIRIVLAELITIVGGAGFLVFWQPGSTIVLPVAIWFFFLVQTIYFFIIPCRIETPGEGRADPFEQASREMERILKTSIVGQ